MKWVAPATFLIVALCACLTVFFVQALAPTSAGAFAFFAAWLVLPYAAIGTALLLLRRKGSVPTPWHVAAVLVSVGGIVFLADAIFWRPDAQGGIAVLMTPILQAVALVLLLPLASWVSRRARAHDAGAI